VLLWGRSGGAPVAVRGSGVKSLWYRHLWCSLWFFAVSGGMGEIASATRSPHRGLPIPSPEPPRSTSDPDQRYYGEATVRLPGGYGAGLEDQATRGPNEMLLGGAETREDRLAPTVAIRCGCVPIVPLLFREGLVLARPLRGLGEGGPGALLHKCTGSRGMTWRRGCTLPLRHA
jgi:hypothetical protein